MFLQLEVRLQDVSFLHDDQKVPHTKYLCSVACS